MFDTVSRSRLSVGASPPVIIDMPIRCIASCTLGYLLPPGQASDCRALQLSVAPSGSSDCLVLVGVAHLCSKEKPEAFSTPSVRSNPPSSALQRSPNRREDRSPAIKIVNNRPCSEQRSPARDVVGKRWRAPWP